MKFNKSFMIGASTAGHQVEGNNKQSDFWTMEHLPHSVFKEPSLDAVDQYNRYEEDIKLMAEAGLTAYRFSIEWARIQPTKDTFDEKEINHYRQLLECCHNHNITPLVTLHHFASPHWLISEGGWEAETTVNYFKAYTARIVTELGDLIPYICTLNEANMGIQIARIMEKFMKQAKKASENTKEADIKEGDVQVGLNMDAMKTREANAIAAGQAFGIDPREVHTFLAPRTEAGNEIIKKCHIAAREVIKAINPNIKVGITLSLYDYQILPGGEALAEKLWYEDFGQYLSTITEDDFFGAQNYTRKICGPNGVVEPKKDAKLTDMGNEYYPQALGNVIAAVAKDWDKEIVVTENGIATTNDEMRVAFIEEALAGVHRCVEAGILVTGYMHWSLLDNFEWQLGYRPRFGLIEVDRTTQTRKPKPSFTYLGSFGKEAF